MECYFQCLAVVCHIPVVIVIIAEYKQVILVIIINPLKKPVGNLQKETVQTQVTTSSSGLVTWLLDHPGQLTEPHLFICKMGIIIRPAVMDSCGDWWS